MISDVHVTTLGEGIWMNNERAWRGSFELKYCVKRLLNTAMSVVRDFITRACVARGSEIFLLFLNLEDECVGSWLSGGTMIGFQWLNQ